MYWWSQPSIFTTQPPKSSPSHPKIAYEASTQFNSLTKVPNKNCTSNDEYDRTDVMLVRFGSFSKVSTMHMSHVQKLEYNMYIGMVGQWWPRKTTNVFLDL